MLIQEILNIHPIYWYIATPICVLFLVILIKYKTGIEWTSTEAKVLLLLYTTLTVGILHSITLFWIFNNNLIAGFILAPMGISVFTTTGFYIVRIIKRQKKKVELKNKKLKELLDLILKSSQFKTEFMSTMSHELRTPLNVIIGFTDLLLEELYGDLNKKQLSFLENISSSATHLLNMINHILDISKIESGKIDLKIKLFRLDDIINQINLTIQPLYEEKNLIFEIKGSYQNVEIFADSIRFKEILYNLLSNAIKFTPNGKVILNFLELDKYWQFDVIDTGIGIAKKDIHLIFKDFKRVDSEYVNKISGTGLGLSISKRFVNLHGGDIWCKSELNKGSTFTFTIPKNNKES